MRKNEISQKCKISELKKSKNAFQSQFTYEEISLDYIKKLTKKKEVEKTKSNIIPNDINELKKTLTKNGNSKTNIQDKKNEKSGPMTINELSSLKKNEANADNRVKDFKNKFINYLNKELEPQKEKSISSNILKAKSNLRASSFLEKEESKNGFSKYTGKIHTINLCRDDEKENKLSHSIDSLKNRLENKNVLENQKNDVSPINRVLTNSNSVPINNLSLCKNKQNDQNFDRNNDSLKELNQNNLSTEPNMKNCFAPLKLSPSRNDGFGRVKDFVKCVIALNKLFKSFSEEELKSIEETNILEVEELEKNITHILKLKNSHVSNLNS